MYRKTFSLYDIFVTFLSFASFILDVITDVAVIVLFFRDGHTVWAAVSLALVALSTFAMQIFSFCWHVTDGTLTVQTFLLHACFLSPLHRFWRVLKLGFKSRRTKSHDDLEAVYSANNDVCLLRLFESFLESAPQLTLQLYIIITFQHFDWILGISTFFSLTSIAWSVSAYSDGLRLAYQSDYRRSGLTMLVHTLWQIAMISGRVLAIVVFASYFQAWTFLFLGVHWLLMTAWITFQNADFGDTACEKRIFNAVSGFVYIFCFLNLKDGPTRGRLTIYYIITLVENTILVILWFLFKPDTSPDWMNIATPTVIYGGFVVGSAMMCLYYCCCHPSKPIAKKEKEMETNWFKRISTMKRKEPNEAVFNTSESSFRISEWLTTSINLSNCDRQNNSVQMSLNLSVPDVVPEKKSAKRFSAKSLSTYHRAASIESSLQESEGNLTMESGRVSYTSLSSTKPLISSASKTSMYRVRAEVNKTLSPESDASSAHVFNYQWSPKSPLSCSNSWNFENEKSSREYDKNLSQSKKDSPQSVQSWKEDAVVPGSGNSAFEYSGKKLSMSPLDPAKLWELSQQRITTINSSDLYDSSCIIPKARENISYQMNDEVDACESNISGRRSSSTRTSHYSTTLSDSQYNSNSEVSGERYDTNYSNSGSSRSQFNSLNQVETSEHVQSSELSNFFADISSLHVPTSGQNRYISSVSETTDILNSSFPWSHDHEVFYDEGDISELVYKQNIRESLLGKSYMYHICPISDATRLGDMSRRLTSNNSYCTSNVTHTSDCTSNVTHTSDSMARISTDDSGYNYSEEAQNNERLCASNKGMDSVMSADNARLNSLMSRSSTSSRTSPIRPDDTGDSRPIRYSLLPGLSYLMSDSDTSCLEKSMQSTKSVADSTLQHNNKTESCLKLNQSTSQDVKVSPLQVSVIETSPLRLGRSVDLFNSSRQEQSDFETPNIVHSDSPVISPKTKLEQLRVLELKESPYKFRGRQDENVPVSSSSVKKDAPSIYNLTESPYKFRSQGFENTSRKFYTIPEKRGDVMNVPHKTRSKLAYENKENRIMDGSAYLTAPSRNRKKKEGNVRSGYKEKHSKPRNRVSALRNSCYAYSDTDSDGEVASNFSSRSQYGDDSDDTYGFSPCKKGNQNSGRKDSRTALRSVENAPIFSPIVTPDCLDREKVCNASGPIMKPVFSTPLTRGEGIDNTQFLMDKPSTIAV